MIWVLDASVAIRWFAPDRDPGDAASERVLRDVLAHPARFVVPDLFFYEVVAVLCRRLRQAKDVNLAADRLVRLGLRRVGPDPKLTRRAVRLAFDHRIGAYDAAYVALALEVRGEWLTFDEAAHDRVADLGVSRVPS